MPSGYNHTAHQHSASNVGGDTRDDSAKNNLYLESQNHSFASIIGVVRSKFTKIEIISVVLLF